jgi:hypothetical protein
MNGVFGVTYEQLQPKLSLSAGPSATKHGPNTMVNRYRAPIVLVNRVVLPPILTGFVNLGIDIYVPEAASMVSG